MPEKSTLLRQEVAYSARGDLLEFSRYSNFGHEGLVSVNILSISLAYCLGEGIRIFVMYSDSSLFLFDIM